MPDPETERWEVLDEAVLDSGDRVALRRRGPLYVVRFNGWELMSSLNPSSELELGRAVGRKLGKQAARVLVGGLGMGFTLRAALDAIAPGGRIEVCEIIPQVVEWNRGLIGHLAGWPLRDGRVTIVEADAGQYLSRAEQAFDAILLDTDNGPDGILRQENEGLYQEDGLRCVTDRLNPDGFAGFWSATRSEAFETRLTRLGMSWHADRIDLGKQGREPFHVIYHIRRRPPLTTEPARQGRGGTGAVPRPENSRRKCRSGNA